MGLWCWYDSGGHVGCYSAGGISCCSVGDRLIGKTMTETQAVLRNGVLLITVMVEVLMEDFRTSADIVKN